MKTMFHETMSSTQAQRVLFDYASAHRGEDLSEVKRQYSQVVPKIVKRELRESDGKMTSYHYE